MSPVRLIASVVAAGLALANPGPAQASVMVAASAGVAESPSLDHHESVADSLDPGGLTDDALATRATYISDYVHSRALAWISLDEKLSPSPTPVVENTVAIHLGILVSADSDFTPQVTNIASAAAVADFSDALVFNYDNPAPRPSKLVMRVSVEGFLEATQQAGATVTVLGATSLDGFFELYESPTSFPIPTSPDTFFDIAVPFDLVGTQITTGRFTLHVDGLAFAHEENFALIDFRNTIRIDGFMLFDADGNPVPAVFTSADSGFNYMDLSNAAAAATPAPPSAALLAVGLLGLTARARRRRVVVRD